MKMRYLIIVPLLIAAGAAAAQDSRTSPESTPTPGAPGASALFGRFDADRDGRISAQEAEMNETLKSNFGAADSNADGFLTPAEFGATFEARP